jgi:hypothetical protein
MDLSAGLGAGNSMVALKPNGVSVVGGRRARRGGSLRAVHRGYSTVIAGLLFVAPALGQDIYVHVRLGCDQWPGTASPYQPVQTISRALVLATSHTLPLTIWIAGGMEAGTSNRLPYNDATGPATLPSTPCVGVPAAAECFPLSMLSRVSLRWDVANSDDLVIATDPPTVQKARPLIRPAAAIAPLPILLRFTNSTNLPPVCSGGLPTYVPGATAVTLGSLDFEGGDPAIDIRGISGATVRPALTDVRVQASRTSLRAVAYANERIAPALSSSLFQLDPNSPGVPQGNLPPLVEMTASGQNASLAGSVSGCTFRAFGSTAAPNLPAAGLRLTAMQSGTVTTSVAGSLFHGAASPPPSSPSGLERGLQLVVDMDPAPNNGASISSPVSASTFRLCGRTGAYVRMYSSFNVTASATSSPSFSGNTFDGNGTAVLPAQPAGQLYLNVGSGNDIVALISKNTFLPAPVNGILVRNGATTSYGVAGTATVNVTMNEIEGQKPDGIQIEATDLVVSGLVDRNKISNCEGDGIDNSAVYLAGTSLYPAANCVSSPAIVGNFIGLNLGNGIFNHVNSFGLTPMTLLVAAPLMSHNTVAANVGNGLLSQADVLTPISLRPTPAVWNSCFGYHTAAGMVDIVEFDPLNPSGIGIEEGAGIFWTNFDTAATSPPVNNNSGMPNPMLVDVSGFDFSLASGSPMRDQASLSPPPPVPTVDIFGRLRQFDLSGVPNDVTNYADKGAHERQTP